MQIIRSLKGAAVALATIGLLIPSGAIAAPKKTESVPQTKAKAAKDVAMLPGGVVTGHVVGKDGTPTQNASVTFQHAGQTVATVTTDSDGIFVAEDLPAGQYTVAAEGTVKSFRLWSEASAPPAADTHMFLVQPTVRGQEYCDDDPCLVDSSCCGDGCDGGCGAGCGNGCMGGIGPALGITAVGALAAAALIVGIIALDKAQDAQDNISP